MAAKLTANVKAGGCASKLSPKILDQALRSVPRMTNEHVLVGYDTADDAGVYDLTLPGGAPLAMVQTVDFFTPIVDDPYTFGGIAAANALSDVYAMGGTSGDGAFVGGVSGQGRCSGAWSRFSKAAPTKFTKRAASFWAAIDFGRRNQVRLFRDRPD